MVKIITAVLIALKIAGVGEISWWWIVGGVIATLLLTQIEKDA